MTVSIAVAALMLLTVAAIAVRSAWSLLFRKAPVPRRRAGGRGRHLPYHGPTDHAGQYPMPGADGIGCDPGSSGSTGG